MRQMNDLSRVSTVPCHFLPDDLPMVGLHCFSFRAALDKTQVVHMLLSSPAELDGVGDGIFSWLTGFKDIDGIEFRPFDWHSEGRNPGENGGGESDKGESTHDVDRRSFSVR